MERAFIRPAVPADAAAVTEIVVALESLYGPSTFSQADLEEEWSDVDLGRDAVVVDDGRRILGYGILREHDDVWRAEGYVHPDAVRRGIGTMIATGLEQDAARRGARRFHNAVLEADAGARALLESLGYVAARVFREMRIELDAPPPAPEWPAGLRVIPFDPDRDAVAFHAAHQQAFADHWEYAPRSFESWAKGHIGGERFDPALWCVVRAGEEIAAGTISTADTYGGGFVHALFTTSTVASARRRRGAPRRRVRAFLGARRAQRRARRRRGERHRRVPPLRARRDDTSARLGRLREGARRWCVSSDLRLQGRFVGAV